MRILPDVWHRFFLLMKAVAMRGLMAIGMKIHHFASPSPPSPSFTVRVPSRLSTNGGSFKLVFYVPAGYHESPQGHRYPVVINYHGGGFTLGTGTDDARWARSVTENARAIFVSVEYRLAPKYPFSIGVEDGADAVIYLAAHADELLIDPHQMALSGFSAGGNFALTVPLMLRDLLHHEGRRVLRRKKHDLLSPPGTGYAQSTHSGSSKVSLNPAEEASTSHLPPDLPIKPLAPTTLEIEQEISSFTLRAIVSFYPPTDFRTTRAEKRSTNPHPEKNLPPLLTNLFDESYITQGRTTTPLDLSDPYLSPMAATDICLREAYPESIILYTCEYDMLNAEGVAFGERLKGPAIKKSVKGGLIKGVAHAFDRKPNPISFPKAAERCYNEATAELNSAFGGRESIESLHQLDLSKSVERFDETDAIPVQQPTVQSAN